MGNSDIWITFSGLSFHHKGNHTMRVGLHSLINPKGPGRVEGHSIGLVLLKGVQGGGRQTRGAGHLFLYIAVFASRDGN